VIKIDTDGFESAISRGSQRALRSVRPALFYEWDPYSYGVAGEDDSSHPEFLMSVGSTRFLIFTNTGQPMVDRTARAPRLGEPGPFLPRTTRY
jgi:hypothetical protein